MAFKIIIKWFYSGGFFLAKKKYLKHFYFWIQWKKHTYMCLSLWIQVYNLNRMLGAGILWLWKKIIVGRFEENTRIWNTIQSVVILPSSTSSKFSFFLSLSLIPQPTNTLITVIAEIAKRAHRSQSSESAELSSLISIAVIPLRSGKHDVWWVFFLTSLSLLLSFGPRCGHSHRSGQPSGVNKTAGGLKRATQVTRKNWLFKEHITPSFK